MDIVNLFGLTEKQRSNEIQRNVIARQMGL
jgi:hypothetical protein